MKIGTLTFHSGPNYGGFFQAKCLAQALNSLGHDVDVINYKNARHAERERFKPWIYRRPAKMIHDGLKSRMFKKDVATLPLSQKKMMTDPAQVPWNDYDAIVVGSDIVWNRSFGYLGRDESYFGRFPSDYDGKLIAYAPSIGPMEVDADVPEWMGEALGRFHAFGVRDANTAAFVKRHTDRDATIVADPTWLVDPVGTKPRENKHPGRMLVYSFPLVGEHSSWGEAIQAFAKKKGLQIDATGYHQPWADRNIASLSNNHWQRTFAEYDYIVCGTFHGGLFSIREEAQFSIVPHYSINSKLVNALNVTGLADRLLTKPDQLEASLLAPVDYASASEKRLAYRQESLGFLSQALSS